ncbi:hypothetical protein FRC02_009817 [Tulasnella sp. 418]|nr:hypothetical protein FRC02_009817 [Tulasnella sp. 418]
MPPKKGIVRSGNAGNSSKASKQAPAPPSGEEKKYLFPPGSKTLVSLLYERCQKNGWEKPTIEPVRLLFDRHSQPESVDLTEESPMLETRQGRFHLQCDTQQVQQEDV